jgi:hypothetical protein
VRELTDRSTNPSKVLHIARENILHDGHSGNVRFGGGVAKVYVIPGFVFHQDSALTAVLVEHESREGTGRRQVASWERPLALLA